MGAQVTVTVAGDGWRVASDARDGIEQAWGARTGGVATAASADAARHRATALALLAPRDAVLVDDESARAAFASLPRGTRLHDLGEAEAPDLRGPHRMFAVTAAADPPPGRRSLDRARTNLPVNSNRFVGRHEELEAIATLLRQNRQVTLTGLGGAGKSRLAQLAGAREVARHRDGVWWVPLAGLGNPAAVVAAIGALVAPASPPDERSVLAHLAGVSTLLVLDQAEHLDLAGLVDALVGAGPEVSVLVASRRPVATDGEAVVPVRGLPTSDAAELFVARSTRETGAPEHVDELCRHLDGLPLAVELMAARAESAGPRELLAAFDAGGVDPVSAAITQAVATLDADDAELLAALVAVPHPTNLEAAAAIAAEPLPAVLDRLDRLVRSSLVVAEPSDDEMRYDVRGAVRGVVAAITSATVTAAARARHLQWCLELASAAYDPLVSEEQPVWLGRLDAERTGLQSALAWAFEHDIGKAVTLATDLWRYWYLRGAVGEGRMWLERAIAADVALSPTERARLLNAAANLAVIQNDVAAARSWLEASVAIRRDDDDPGLADALNDLGIVRSRSHDLAGAVAAFRESVAVARRADIGFSVANATVNLSAALTASGDPAAGLLTAQEGLAAWESVGLPLGVAAAHSGIATALLALGDHHGARAHLLTCLGGVASSGGSGHVPAVLEGLAAAANGLGEHEEAARLLGAAAALREELETPVPEDERADVDRQRAQALAALGEPRFTTAAAAGGDEAEAVVNELLGDRACLAREGEVWRVDFGGRSVRVRHTLGLGQLAVLLGRPGQAVSVAELAGGRALDEAARERARKAVRKSLRQAIARLADLHPALGAHLDVAVTTGTVCTYAPELPVRWEITDAV